MYLRRVSGLFYRIVPQSPATGMIARARSEPSRWHLVLFDWRNAALTGRRLPFPLVSQR
jgi:hypothetical protein